MKEERTPPNTIKFRVKNERRNTNWGQIGVIGLISLAAGAAIGIEFLTDERSPIVQTVSASFSSGFPICDSGPRTNCVVDGDTIWFDGEKVRLLGIDTPETNPPRCAYEGELGAAATRRLRELLDGGTITLRRGDAPDRDRYGRLLRHVDVDGRDVGSILIAEGLARPYGNGRRSWC